MKKITFTIGMLIFIIGFSQNNYNIKSSNELKQVLDSIVYETYIDSVDSWLYSEKLETKYNSNLDTLTKYFSWDSNTSQWIYEMKSVSTYDNNVNVIANNEYYWDSNTNQFINGIKVLFSYDENNNRTVNERYDWDYNTEQYNITEKYTYDYDANFNLIEEGSYNWVGSPLSFEKSIKYEYTYNTYNNKTFMIKYILNTTTDLYEPIQKINYEYDNNEYLIQIEDSTTDNNNNWKFNSKQILNYDTIGNCIEKITYEYDTALYIAGKYIYTYDNNNLIQTDEYNSNNGGLLLYTTTKLYYNNNNNYITKEFIDYLYQPFTYKIEYSINDSIEYSDLVFPHSITTNSNVDVNLYDQNAQMLSILNYEWNTTINDWVKTDRSTWYYTLRDIDFVNKINVDNINVYPNPSTNNIFVNIPNNKTSRIAIINSSGKILKEIKTENEITIIDLKDFDKGIYFLSIKNNNSTSTKKIILK